MKKIYDINFDDPEFVKDLGDAASKRWRETAAVEEAEAMKYFVAGCALQMQFAKVRAPGHEAEPPDDGWASND